MRRREVGVMRVWAEDGWTYFQVFYAALYTLLVNGLIHGEVRRMIGGAGAFHSVDHVWLIDAGLAATELGFVVYTGVPRLSLLCTASSCLTFVAPDASVVEAVLLVLPCFMENPTAYLEKMWYMQDYCMLLHHCCYCRYGAGWRKATTFWLRNFVWHSPLRCTAATPCDHVAELGYHPLVIGGNSNHSMADKWHVPYSLCVELLRCMLAVRPSATWFLTLFGGAGSFDLPCRTLGLTHVSISYDRPSDPGGDEGRGLHICMDLSGFKMVDVLTRVWHLTGLCASDLLGYGAHPGCETFSLMASGSGHRDHSAEGFHLALSDEALAADAVAYGGAAEMFPGLEGSYLSRFGGGGGHDSE